MAQDHREGEEKWLEWVGEGLETDFAYYTIEHISTDIPMVRRALASALQRDGVADNLGAGFRLIEGTIDAYLYAGTVDGSKFLSICGSNGLTVDGEIVDEVFAITVVEL